MFDHGSSPSTLLLRPAGGPCCSEVGAMLRMCVVRLCYWGDHVSALIFKYALKIQTLMSGIKDSPGFNTITSLCMLHS